MAVFSQVSVTTTPTQIAPVNGNRKALIIVNRGTADLYIGASSAIVAVPDATNPAIQLRAQEQLNFGADPSEIWGVAVSGTQRVDVVEIT